MRLHTKIILLIVTVTLGAGLGSSLLVSRMMHDALDSELRDQAILAVESLAERVTYHVIDDEVIEAREAARKMMERSESIQYVYIIDFDGRLFAHTFEGGFPKALVADTLQHDPMYAQSPRIVHLEIGTGRVLDIGYPLIDGMAAHVHIGMDEEHTRARVASLRNGIIGLSLLLAGAGIAIGALVSWRMTRPLSDLAGVMRDFGTRTWEEEVEFRGGGREMAHLTRAFNQMISDRVRAESHRDAALEALQTSRDIQDAILSTTDVLLAYLDKEFNFIAVNQAYADAGRRRREDFIGKNYFDLYPYAENEAIFNQAVETGEAQFVSGKPFEHPDQPERGTTWWDWSLIPLKDESGSARTLVFSLLDVTARVEATIALQKERDFAESLVNTAQTIVLVLDVEGRIVRFNPYMEKLSGYSLAEVQGQDWFNTFLLEKDHSSLRALFQKAVGDIQTRGNVNPIMTKDGSEREIEWYDKTLKDADGNVVGLLSIGQDVTERVQAEEQIKQALAEKTTLLQELYHRTRNNMQVIQSMLALRSLYIQDEQLLTIVKDVQDKIQAMSLVHQKLYESRDLSRIDLKEYIDDLAAYLLQSYQVLPDRISLDLDTDSVFVLIDTAVPCGLVLSELISNALKHAFPGDRKGRISIRLHQAEDETITLQVSDDGIGVPGDLDFRQSDSLGLQTVVGIVERQLQGEMSLETDRGVAWQIRFRDHFYSPRV